jgi:NADP-dependent 3-hydroxy acid dehydrogenase YdfG
MSRTAVVTGATGGIGAAVVRVLTARGDRVLAVGRSADALSDLGAGVVPVVLDLARPFELPGELAGLERLDALVHCAGIADVAAVGETGPDLWQRMLTVNVAAAAELTRGLLPALRAARGGVLFVNMADGPRPVPRWSAYVASKAALVQLADTLRLEERDLRVTTLYPGGTATGLLARVRADFGAPYDPERAIRPDTMAGYVLMALDAPTDAYPAELTIAPAPGIRA